MLNKAKVSNNVEKTQGLDFTKLSSTIIKNVLIAWTDLHLISCSFNIPMRSRKQKNTDWYAAPCSFCNILLSCATTISSQLCLFSEYR